MAEPRRIDHEYISDERTLNDAEERSQQARDREGRPQLLRNESSVPSERLNITLSSTDDPAAKPKYPGAVSTASSGYAESAAPSAGTQLSGEAAVASDQPVLLFADTEVSDYPRWSNIQAGFVDEPRQAVEDADNLVKSVLEKLSQGFTHERDRLAKQWDRGENVSTEDLRIALQRYRSFFDRLLNVRNESLFVDLGLRHFTERTIRNVPGGVPIWQHCLRHGVNWIACSSENRYARNSGSYLDRSDHSIHERVCPHLLNILRVLHHAVIARSIKSSGREVFGAMRRVSSVCVTN